VGAAFLASFFAAGWIRSECLVGCYLSGHVLCVALQVFRPPSILEKRENA